MIKANGEPYKIAIVGIENSPTTHMIEYFDVATERSRAQVVALVGEDDPHMAELMELGGISQRADGLRQAQSSRSSSVL